MRQISKIIFLSLNIFIIISCKKTDDKIEAHTIIHKNYPPLIWIYDTIINQHLIDDYLFNKGSFWIYQDSITQIIDTCIVDTVLIKRSSGFGINCLYFSKYVSSHKISKFFNSYDLHNNSILYGGIFFDSIQLNGDFYLDNKHTFFPYYSIDTAIYSNVYKLFYKSPYISTTIPDSGYYYMKAGIGIIKSEYYKNGQKSVYEMKQYHIN